MSRSRLNSWFLFGCLLAWQAVAASLFAASAEEAIPYVPTRQDVVRDLLWLAGVTTNDVVYDLGSGDGRVVIQATQNFGARKAVGIELDPKLVEQSGSAAARAGVRDRVSIIQGDLFTNNLSEATVVVLYLGHTPNLRLRPKLYRELRPGTRVVTHQFGMGEWPPDKQLSVRTVYLGMFGRMHNWYAQNTRVPDFELNPDLSTKAVGALYTMPAKVAGNWKGDLVSPKGRFQIGLTLHQTLTEITGTFQLHAAETNLEGRVRVDLWGDNLRFDGYVTGQSYAGFRMIFDGLVDGSSLKGRLDLVTAGKEVKGAWLAQREKCDYTGEWGWSEPTPDRPVKLRIEKTNGFYRATLADKGRLISVEDFYDFGGGFYFTHMVDKVESGPDTWSVQMTKDAGWLIGEAVIDGPGLKGRLWFFPHPGAQGDPSSPGGRRQAVPDVSGPWKPACP